MDAPLGPALPGVTEFEVDGRISVFSPRTQLVVMLNETASDVWRLSDGDHSPGEVIELLAAAYATTPDLVHDDIMRVIRQFVDAGLVSAPDDLDTGDLHDSGSGSATG